MYWVPTNRQIALKKHRHLPPKITDTLEQATDQEITIRDHGKELLEALERAYEVLDGIADKLFFSDGQPVTSLTAGQIEKIYFDALSEHVAFTELIRRARGEA